jgi:hypothetical protein
MKLDKISTLFKQLNFLNATRLSIAEVIHKILDPYNITSYSQTGEDRIIDAILSKECGFYVDVGCNHPQYYSNTFALYKKGWNGITIDANEALIQRHKRLREKDSSFCTVVSNQEKEIVFTEFEDSLVSSVDSQHVSEWRKTQKIRECKLVCVKQ